MTQGHNGSPPPPAAPPPPEGLGAGRPARPTQPRSTPTSPHGRPVASVPERIGSRAIDAAVFLPLIFLLTGIEAIVRAVSGVEAAESGDWVSSSVGFARPPSDGVLRPVDVTVLRGDARQACAWSSGGALGRRHARRVAAAGGTQHPPGARAPVARARRHRPAADRPTARRPQLGRPGDGYSSRQREGCSVSPIPADAVATRTVGTRSSGRRTERTLGSIGLWRRFPPVPCASGCKRSWRGSRRVRLSASGSPIAVCSLLKRRLARTSRRYGLALSERLRPRQMLRARHSPRPTRESWHQRSDSWRWSL